MQYNEPEVSESSSGEDDNRTPKKPNKTGDQQLLTPVRANVENESNSSSENSSSSNS